MVLSILANIRKILQCRSCSEITDVVCKDSQFLSKLAAIPSFNRSQIDFRHGKAASHIKSVFSINILSDIHSVSLLSSKSCGGIGMRACHGGSNLVSKKYNISSRA